MTLRRRTEDELRGERLYGEQLSPQEVTEWFEDEREAYAELGSANRSTYRYPDHAINARHGFRLLPWVRYPHALGIGSAHGDEFLPLQGQIDDVAIVEPSSALRECRLGIPHRYLDPSPTGFLPVESGDMDLVLCLGVLHHIPNVSTMINEIGRVLRPGGFALIREPTVSMGDWTQPRYGLTSHERGIPIHLLTAFIDAADLESIKETRYGFPATPRLGRLLHVDTYNTGWLVHADELVCRGFGWNRRYHANRWYQKLRPTALYVVARKRSTNGADLAAK